MSRTANSSIAGYIYQFAKSLIEILEADGDELIKLEGPIEDIERIGQAGEVTAIQCKYHFSKTGYSLSRIYKPVLQMLLHRSMNPGLEIRYVIFAHYPERGRAECTLSIADIESVMASSANELKKIIKKIRGNILGSTKYADINELYSDFASRFSIEFGDSLEDLKGEAIELLGQTHLDGTLVKDFHFPVAFYEIACISAAPIEQARIITRAGFLETLAKTNDIVINKLTLALRTKRQMLDALKAKLKPGLVPNSSERCIYLSESDIGSFRPKIVRFIRDFLQRYHSKRTHRHPPTFYLNCELDLFYEICEALLDNGVRFENGMIGDRFSVAKFRWNAAYGPKVKPDSMCFQVRVACTKTTTELLSQMSFTDIYLVGSEDEIVVAGDKMGVEITRLPVKTFMELSHILGV